MAREKLHPLTAVARKLQAEGDKHGLALGGIEAERLAEVAIRAVAKSAKGYAQAVILHRYGLA